MTKTGGLGDNFLIDEFDISGDVGVIDTIESPMSPLTTTGIDKYAYERLSGQRDGLIEFTSYFNDATNQEHDALSGLPTGDVIATYLRGISLGDEAASVVGKQVNYDPSRGDDGSLTVKTQVVCNGFGVEWGHNLTGDGTTLAFTSTGAEDLPGFDDGAGAATDFGLQAYLHVLAIAGGTFVATLEDSDDDGTDPYAAITGGAFASTSAVGSQRIQTSRTENVKEWIRVATSGTYTSVTFAVVVVRNLTAVAF